MKKNIFVPLFLCLFLPACFSHSISQLKMNYPDPYQFTVEKGYQEKYRDLLALLDHCMPYNIRLDINGNLYTDKKMAEISWSDTSFLDGRRFILYIVLIEAEDKTMVTIYDSSRNQFISKHIEAGKCG